MPIVQSLPWTEPLSLAAAIDAPHWLLLYSGRQTAYSGRYSYLAVNLAETVVAEDFMPLASKLSANDATFDNAWFGYLGYGLNKSLEGLAPDAPHWLTLPNLCMTRFHTIYVFDHTQRSITLWSDLPSPQPLKAGELREAPIPGVIALTSNMSTESYLNKVEYIIERIHAGDLYQANLTRKFNGQFRQAPDPFSLFCSLCRVSPAPYSAYMRMGDAHILSSSPEQFLRVHADGKVETRPIKGTAPRHSDSAQDEISRAWLASSAKDRAENLMITDLMRNDLSRSCIPGSITAEALFDITSHASVHHMSSTITGRKRPDITTLELVRHCFPPGSMTGAPKIRAMSLCSALELQERGIYSGAIGWLGGDGACELSVVIRTLLIKENRFEFQVGGGIVADSIPHRELQEICDKAEGMLKVLGLSADALKAL